MDVIRPYDVAMFGVACFGLVGPLALPSFFVGVVAVCPGFRVVRWAPRPRSWFVFRRRVGLPAPLSPFSGFASRPFASSHFLLLGFGKVGLRPAQCALTLPLRLLRLLCRRCQS